jgi:Leucine-rich repeat (LRR) protein
MIQLLLIELINCICSYLEPKEVVNLSATCKSLWSQRSELTIHDFVELKSYKHYRTPNLNIFKSKGQLTEEDIKRVKKAERIHVTDYEFNYNNRKLFSSCKELILTRCQVKTPLFPQGLTTLVLELASCVIYSSNYVFPPSLKVLELVENRTIVKLSKDHKSKELLTIPDGITHLTLKGRRMKLAKLPCKLKSLSLSTGIYVGDYDIPSTITEFEFKRMQDDSHSLDQGLPPSSLNDHQLILNIIKLPNLRSLTLEDTDIEEVLELKDTKIITLSLENCCYEWVSLPLTLKEFKFEGFMAHFFAFRPFSELTNLESFDLEIKEGEDEHGLNNIEQKDINSNLKSLSLHHVQIPEELQLPKNLEKLDLDTCQILHFPTLPDTLREISLYNCQIESGKIIIPPSVKVLKIDNTKFYNIELRITHKIDQFIIDRLRINYFIKGNN